MDVRDLSGKRAIVSGGGTGIGQGIALALADHGAAVAVLGRRSEPIETTAAAIRNRGGEATAIRADVSSESEARQAVATADKLYGGVDILVNNAGISGSGSIHEHSVEAWDRVLAVNLRGPFLMARYTLPLMRKQREGHIINISSEAGLEHYPGNGAYGVSKHALNALAEYIQRENQDLGIRVDTICPGMVVTEMTEQSTGLNHAKSLYPEDIADLTLWLLSRRSNIKIGRPVLIQTMLNPWT
jgi:NAD(P)-dependent dehydrogenase (short-subunit alcohol dehydrogenase family)